jgi:2-polyprenyl-6-hydroxyphenyl methylase/3-demethylubiquinone-9 3-methyltransferase
MSDEIQKIRREKVLTQIKNRSGRVLDIGCQDGDMCQILSEKGFEAFGIDIFEENVAEAKKKYPDLDFRIADSEEKIPFPDEFFDIVWAGDVIEHVRYTDTFVNEVNRVLRTGGSFFLSTPEHNLIKNLLIVLFRFDNHFDPEFPHYRFYTRNSLSNVLEKRGFKILSVNHIGRFRPLSNSMLVISEKKANKSISSKYHY